MDRHASIVGRMLEELDSDPAVAALRRRCTDATPSEFRAARGAWAAAVLRALWRAVSGASVPAAAPRPRAGARR